MHGGAYACMGEPMHAWASICVHGRAYVCMAACLHGCEHAWLRACMAASMHGCEHVWLREFMAVSICVHGRAYACFASVCVLGGAYACVGERVRAWGGCKRCNAMRLDAMRCERCYAMRAEQCEPCDASDVAGRCGANMSASCGAGTGGAVCGAGVCDATMNAGSLSLCHAAVGDDGFGGVAGGEARSVGRSGVWCGLGVAQAVCLTGVPDAGCGAGGHRCAMSHEGGLWSQRWCASQICMHGCDHAWLQACMAACIHSFERMLAWASLCMRGRAHACRSEHMYAWL